MSIEIPENISELSDEELEALSEQIQAEAGSLAEKAATDDEALGEMEKLVELHEQVRAEAASREAAAADRKARADEALEKLSSDAPAADGDAEVSEADEADEPETETDTAAASAEGEQVEVEAEELADESAAPEAVESEAAASDEASTEDAEELSSEGTETETEPEGEATTPDPATFTPEENMDSNAQGSPLASHVPDDLDPVESEATPAAGMTASNAAPGVAEGTPLDIAELANAIVTKRHGMNNASAGSYERIPLATAQASFTHAVGGGAQENFEVFRTVQQEWAASRQKETALVASGGVCAMPEPRYDFFRLAEELNPVESALPDVEAPRGGIRFVTPPDWTDAQAGVRVTTNAQDAAGYGGENTAVKPCVVVECPTPDEATVDAVSKCVQFGNLNYRVFPEQVEAFLADLSVAHVQEKEIFYLDAIDGDSTAVTAEPAYGATRGATMTLLRAAANYRRRHHMSPSAVLAALLPSWFVEFIKADLVNDHSMGLGFLEAGEAEVAAWLASMNIDVTWYYDGATGAGQEFSDAQSAGALNEFPTSVVSYLFAPGTFARLDAGTLDVGIVRDSTLNGTNDLQIFAEQWVQVVKLGLESIRLEITLCPDGTAPEPTTPLTCAASS